jgi:UDP-glucose 4-epimerase
MSKILVTGGAGFIGNSLVESLVENNHEVIVLDTLIRGNKLSPKILKEVELITKDVRDKDAVIKYSKDCDKIFHLAAILGVDIVADNPTETMDVEVIGMQNVVAASLKNDINKIIYASTSGIYGHSAIMQSVTEDVRVDPRTSYSIAKRFNEIYLKAQNDERGLESVSMRFFNVYGPKQDSRMVVPRFFEQAMSNQSITIYGSGMQTRDFTYIEDAVKATILLSEKSSGCEIVNVAHEQELNIKELAYKIWTLTGSSSNIEFIETSKKRYDYEVERRFGCSEKLFAITGYKPQTDIDSGLTKIFNHYKKNE